VKTTGSPAIIETYWASRSANRRVPLPAAGVLRTRCITVQEHSSDISGAELSAAFRLGFFSRHFDHDALIETLDALPTRIVPSMLLRLKKAVQSSSSSGGKSDSLVAVADIALLSTTPCRVLYDLGAVFGDYHLRRLTAVGTPDAGPIWECVRRMPNWLVGIAGCLRDLAEEANGGQNLDAVMSRVNKPWAQMLMTDDDGEYRTNYRRILSTSPSWVQRMWEIHGDLSMIMFVYTLDRELAEASNVIDTAKGVLAKVAGKVDSQCGDRDGLQSKTIVSKQSKPRCKAGAWAHDGPPDAQEYSGGRLEGELQELAHWVSVAVKTLKKMNKDKKIWIAPKHGKNWEIWFKTLREFEDAWKRKKETEKGKPSRNGRKGT